MSPESSPPSSPVLPVFRDAGELPDNSTRGQAAESAVRSGAALIEDLESSIRSQQIDATEARIDAVTHAQRSVELGLAHFLREVPLDKLALDSIVAVRDGVRLIYMNLSDEIIEGLDGADATEQGKSLKALDIYKFRLLLALFGSNNVLLVPKRIRSFCLEVRSYLSEVLGPHMPVEIIPADNIIGIDTSEKKLAEAFVDVLRSDTNERIRDLLPQVEVTVPFIGSGNADEICRLISEQSGQEVRVEMPGAAADELNHKGYILKELQSRGVNVAPGGEVFSLARALEMFRDLQARGFSKVGVRLPRSASGLGLATVESEADLLALYNDSSDPKWKFHLDPDAQKEHTFMANGAERTMLGWRMDGWMDYSNSVEQVSCVASPGVMVFVGETDADTMIFAHTDQVLSKDNVHLGNMHPPAQDLTNDMRKALYETVQLARERGYTGILGVDFFRTEMLDKETGNVQRRDYVAEINARITGQTHGALAVAHLFGSALSPDWGWWSHNNVETEKGMSFAEFVDCIDKAGLRFDPQKGGLIPATYDPGEGKAQVVYVCPRGAEDTPADTHQKLLAMDQHLVKAIRAYTQGKLQH